jgi:hypothetical protein
MEDCYSFFSLLIALVPKPGGRLPPHVVKRLEDALRDPDATIDKTYIQQLAVNFNTTI